VGIRTRQIPPANKQDAHRARAHGISRCLDLSVLSHRWCFAPTRVNPFAGAPLDRVVQRCTEDRLRAYEAIPGHSSRDWRCPRYLNSGAYAGRASDVAELARLWAQYETWHGPCNPRPKEGHDDQCIAMQMQLWQNVSIGLDYHEALFANGGAATPASRRGREQLRTHEWTGLSKRRNSTHCNPCGRVRCGCSLLPAWQVPARKTGRAAAASLALTRRDDYRAMCGVAKEGPFAIHFNSAASKWTLRHPTMQRWIHEVFPLPPDEPTQAGPSVARAHVRALPVRRARLFASIA
jgi:hypothetical protein